MVKQVNGLRDDNGNRTAQFYDMQNAIKAASEQLPMDNCAIDYAALVEGDALNYPDDNAMPKGANIIDVLQHMGGVECVQRLSCLNRTYPGKAQSGTFKLDLYNGPNEILGACQPYYQTAELTDVSDPQLVFKLF